MIKIGKPYITLTNEKAILSAKVFIPEYVAIKYKTITQNLKNTPWRTDKDYPPEDWKKDRTELTYETDKKYADLLCIERADAYVVAMLWYAIITGEDIEFEAPLSNRLYHGLTEKLIPAICRNEYRQIKLIGPLTEEKLQNKGAVGTGMSCGVDSFYSLRTHNEVSHLAYFECGHIFHMNGVLDNPSIREFYDATNKVADKRAEAGYDIANRSGKEFVYVKSNLDKNF